MSVRPGWWVQGIAKALVDGGKPVRSGKWQIMVNGESYKWIVAEAGAELTMMENRFVPARFKDGYGPVGTWFLLFKAKATNAFGESYMETNKALLDDSLLANGSYGQAKVPASCLRNYLMMKEMREGRGPIWMDTVSALGLHELLRAWENYHRILTAEAHMKRIQFREESRYAGFYYRMDYNFVDETNWKCFVNSVYDKDTRTWTCFKRAHVDIVDKSKLFN